MTETIRVLIVESSPQLVEMLAAALRESDESERFHLSRVATVADASKRIDPSGADVVLLPLPGAREGVLPLVELRAAAPELPVVVLARTADEPLAIKAVHLGATDYLIAEQIYGTLVVRCIRHAVETQRVQSQLARREAQWPPSLLPDRDLEGRAAALRTALPRAFQELVEQYGGVLDHAVQQVLHRVEPPLEHSMQQLARRAGELRAGPRDVVEIHAAAMKERELETGPQRMQLYAAEGRIRLLELMGLLVTYYRGLSLPRWQRPEDS